MSGIFYRALADRVSLSSVSFKNIRSKIAGRNYSYQIEVILWTILILLRGEI
jgi:hypothetical protein